MTIAKKICMLGDPGVGKTSLVRRYVLGDFSPTYQATLGVNVYKFTDPDAETPVDLMIWDIEGGIQSLNLAQTYMVGAAGAVIVGDLTRDDLDDSLAKARRSFATAAPGRPAVFALNKADLADSDFAAAKAAALAAEDGGQALATSAATGHAVPELFRALTATLTRIGA